MSGKKTNGKIRIHILHKQRQKILLHGIDYEILSMYANLMFKKFILFVRMTSSNMH